MILDPAPIWDRSGIHLAAQCSPNYKYVGIGPITNQKALSKRTVFWASIHLKRVRTCDSAVQRLDLTVKGP